MCHDSHEHDLRYSLHDSCMCNVSLSYTTWPIHICHDSFMCVMTHTSTIFDVGCTTLPWVTTHLFHAWLIHMCHLWFIHICDITVTYNSFIYEITHLWSIHIYETTHLEFIHSYVKWFIYDLFIRDITHPRLIQIWNHSSMIHPYIWHDPLIIYSYTKPLIYDWFILVTRLTHNSSIHMKRLICDFIHTWHNSSTIYTCDKTHLQFIHMWHDSSAILPIYVTWLTRARSFMLAFCESLLGLCVYHDSFI